LVDGRLLRNRAAFAHFFRQLNHLEDGGSAIQAGHVVADHGCQRRVALGSTGASQFLHHHRDHDVHPAAADQRQGAIKVEDDRSKAAARQVWVDDFNGFVEDHGGYCKNFDGPKTMSDATPAEEPKATEAAEEKKPELPPLRSV